MSVGRLSTVSGYVEYIDLNPNPQIGTLLGYVEYIGTPEKIALTEDGQVHAVVGYVEYVVCDPNPEIANLLGYAEYIVFDPAPSPQAVMGYLEWIGTPEPIALAKDSQINTTLAYIDYIWDGKTPGPEPGPTVIFGPGVWIV